MEIVSQAAAAAGMPFQNVRDTRSPGVADKDGSRAFGVAPCEILLSPIAGKNALSAMRTSRSSFGRAPVSVRSATNFHGVTVAAVPKREADFRKRVVITGMGLVSVFGNDVDTFYEKLLAGESGISVIDRFDASIFPTTFAGQIPSFDSEGYISAKNEPRLDNCIKYGLVSGHKALKNARLGSEEIQKLDRLRIGVLVGSGIGAQMTFAAGVKTLLDSKRRQKRMSPFFVPYINVSAASALLAIDLGLMGPNYSISTACATSNHCFYAAANHIRSGDADVMIAGGTESPITPVSLGGFTACRALSQRNQDPQAASRPWDKERAGFVLGEGAGVLVMESLEHALKRDAKILAEYLGGAVNCDAHSMTDPRADGVGVALCIQKALENAAVSPEEVNYVNAHATSTVLGDVAEVNGLNLVFKDEATRRELKMNSTKSMIGHALGGAGGLEAIATIKAISTGWLHPTLNQVDLDAAVTFDTVPDVKTQHTVHVAVSNSFGFGGHNACIVLAPFSK